MDFYFWIVVTAKIFACISNLFISLLLIVFVYPKKMEPYLPFIQDGLYCFLLRCFHQICLGKEMVLHIMDKTMGIEPYLGVNLAFSIQAAFLRCISTGDLQPKTIHLTAFQSYHGAEKKK